MQKYLQSSLGSNLNSTKFKVYFISKSHYFFHIDWILSNKLFNALKYPQKIFCHPQQVNLSISFLFKAITFFSFDKYHQHENGEKKNFLQNKTNSQVIQLEIVAAAPACKKYFFFFEKSSKASHLTLNK